MIAKPGCTSEGAARAVFWGWRRPGTDQTRFVGEDHRSASPAGQLPQQPGATTLPSNQARAGQRPCRGPIYLSRDNAGRGDPARAVARRVLRGRRVRRGPVPPGAGRRSAAGAAAPPAVAACTASAADSPHGSTASATTRFIDDVYDDPGLQLDANATRAPASSRARPGAGGWRVDRSQAGSRVATVDDPASRSMSAGRQVGAVVHRGGAEVAGDPHAGARTELVAVHPQSQPASRPGRPGAGGSGRQARARPRGRRVRETRPRCGVGPLTHAVFRHGRQVVPRPHDGPADRRDE